MISFQSSEDELAFVKVAAAIAQEYIRPSAREMEEQRKVSPEIIAKLTELGLTNMELPESFGGLELPLITQVQILEALSSGDLAAIQGLPGINDASSFIRMEPDNPRFAELKNLLQQGKPPVTAALVLQRRANLTIEITSKGYRLNGISSPVKMGAAASQLCIAGTDETGEDVLIWLENSEGSVWKDILGDYRLGLLASQCARLQFDQLAVSDDQVVARGEAARAIIDNSLARIRVLEAAKELGIMSAALSYATEYTSGRKAFGKEIAKFQGVSFTVAQMAIQTQAARNLVWNAAVKHDQQESAAIAASMSALNFAHHAVLLVTDAAVQLLGGHGYVQDHPVEKWMRDAQAQVNLLETEDELLVKSGEYLLTGKEVRELQDDFLRADRTAKTS